MKVLQNESKLVRLTTKDGLELQGLWYSKPKHRGLIIHVHGWTGNFYENEFLDHEIKSVMSLGYDFLSFNNRGAGFVQEFLKKLDGHSTERVEIGGSKEVFEECLHDIDAAIAFAKEAGYREVILQGHSSGCQKVTYHQLQVKDPIVKKLILIEPTDDPAVVKRIMGAKKYKAAVLVANKMVKNGNENDSLPSDLVPFAHEITPSRFLSLSLSSSAEGSLFDFQNKHLDLVRKIEIPILVVYGGKTQYQQNLESVSSLIQEKIPNSEVNIIQSGDHWFQGCESELTGIINKWLSRSK